MHATLSVQELKSHMRSEIAAAKAFLGTTQQLAELLQDHAPDMEKLAQNNVLSMQQAEEMQALHVQRTSALEALGVQSVEGLFEQGFELVAIEAEHKSILEQSRALNFENGTVVSALFTQAQEQMKALQAAAQQGDTYVRNGQRPATGSRPLACV